MKKLLILVLGLSMIFAAGMANAEETSFDASITLAQPFSITSATAAQFGTFYTTGVAETLTMNVVGIATTVGADTTTAPVAPTITDGELIVGSKAPVALAAPQTPGVIIIEANTANVDLAVSLVGTPNLDKGFYTGTATPITVNGITSNVTNFNAATIAADTGATLCVGPVLSVPANAETGSYTGSVTVDITAI